MSNVPLGRQISTWKQEIAQDAVNATGLVLSGASPNGHLVEVVEIADHPWFVACQFHPEFKSRPDDPHPLFSGFVGAALERRRLVTSNEKSEAETSITTSR